MLVERGGPLEVLLAFGHVEQLDAVDRRQDVIVAMHTLHVTPQVVQAVKAHAARRALVGPDCGVNHTMTTERVGRLKCHRTVLEK